MIGVASATTTPVSSSTCTDAPASSTAAPTASVSRESCADPVMAGSYTLAAVSRSRLVVTSSGIHHSLHYPGMTVSSMTVMSTSAVTSVIVWPSPGNRSLSVAVLKSLSLDVVVCE